MITMVDEADSTCPDYTTKIPRGVYECIPGKTYEFCVHRDSKWLSCAENRKDGICPRGRNG